MRLCASYVSFPNEMATKHRPGTDDGDTGVATETKKKEQLKKPQLFRVIFHNDNYTTMEFVIAVLRDVFHKSESDSVSIMLNVHRKTLHLHVTDSADYILVVGVNLLQQVRT